jgi:hypothetical protein
MTQEATQILWEVGGQTYHLTLDIYSNRTLDLTSEITEHPVESGGTVVDHIRPVPDVISIAGLVSNQPCFIPLDYAEGASGFTKVEVKGARRTIGNTVTSRVPAEVHLIPGVPAGIPIGAALVDRIPLPGVFQTAVAFKPNTPFDRPKAVVAALRKLRSDRILVSLNTRLVRYDNLAIQSIQIVENAARYVISVAMSFKQIKIGTAVTVEVPGVPTQRAAQATKTTKPKPVEEPQQASSVANNMFGN